MKRFVLVAAMLGALAVTPAHAQFYLSPFFGFKSYGLKGPSVIVANGQTTRDQTEVQAGKTSFNFGANVGYQVLHTKVYNLDLGLDASLAWCPFLETGFNKINGAGSFKAQGLKGGKTMNLGFDLVPMNRFTIPGFPYLEPFAGVGLSVNIFSTADVTAPLQGGGTTTLPGKSQFKMGMLFAWGTNVPITKHLVPFVEMKHLLPFGNEFQLTDDPRYTVTIEDTPGFFGLTGGMKFVL